MTDDKMCEECVRFWKRHTKVHPSGEVEVNTIGRLCPCQSAAPLDMQALMASALEAQAVVDSWPAWKREIARGAFVSHPKEPEQ